MLDSHTFDGVGPALVGCFVFAAIGLVSTCIGLYLGIAWLIQHVHIQ